MNSNNNENYSNGEKLIKSKNKKISNELIENFEETFNESCKNYNIKYHSVYFPSVNKIVVFGDIHGDWELTLSLLKNSNLIDDDLNWIGKDTYVVQIGDQIDRWRPDRFNKYNEKEDEHSDILIMELFNKLDLQAQQHDPPGRVLSLIGNHEILNVKGYFQYVSPKGIKGFNNYIDPVTNEQYKDGFIGRAHAFAPGNEYSKMMACTRYSYVIIGSNIFVHAGFTDSFFEKHNINDMKDLEVIDKKIRLWLLGFVKTRMINNLIGQGKDSNESIFWTRVLGNMKTDQPMSFYLCKNNLLKTFKFFDLNDNKQVRMIIGHTPQSFINYDNINSTCDKRVWRVDNGSSKAFDMFNNINIFSYRKVQYLKIINDKDYYICDENSCELQV